MKQLVADIKARAPSNLLELIDAITDEGQLLHIFAVDCERRGIPFLPFKRTEKEEKGGNEQKKPRLEGGGGETSYKEKRTQCNSCGKYHLGACDPNSQQPFKTRYLGRPTDIPKNVKFRLENSDISPTIDPFILFSFS